MDVITCALACSKIDRLEVYSKPHLEKKGIADETSMRRHPNPAVIDRPTNFDSYLEI